MLRKRSLVDTSKGSFGWVFLSLDGRIARQTYWLASLILFAFELLFRVVAANNTVGSYGLILLLAILVYPGVCLVGKRWHDRGKSAWWVLVLAIPIVGWIWTLVECGLLAGDDGPNRYGSEVTRTPFDRSEDAV